MTYLVDPSKNNTEINYVVSVDYTKMCLENTARCPYYLVMC